MLVRILIRWIVTAIAVAVAVLVLSWIEPTWVTLNGNSAIVGLVVMSAALGLVNALIRPILQFLSCGCIIATLGLFTLVINAFTLWLAGWISSWFNSGFTISVPWGVFWGALIISVVSFVLNIFVPDEYEVE